MTSPSSCRTLESAASSREPGQPGHVHPQSVIGSEACPALVPLSGPGKPALGAVLLQKGLRLRPVESTLRRPSSRLPCQPRLPPRIPPGPLPGWPVPANQDVPVPKTTRAKWRVAGFRRALRPAVGLDRQLALHDGCQVRGLSAPLSATNGLIS